MKCRRSRSLRSRADAPAPDLAGHWAATFALPRLRRGSTRPFSMWGRWRHGRSMVPAPHRRAAKARELYFMPGKFDAEEALRIGLVSRLFSDAALHDEVVAIANRIADAAPIALRTMKANFLAAERSSFATISRWRAAITSISSRPKTPGGVPRQGREAQARFQRTLRTSHPSV